MKETVHLGRDNTFSIFLLDDGSPLEDLSGITKILLVVDDLTIDSTGNGNGYITNYAHLSVIGVSMCQSVYAGQWLGTAGNTGNSRGVHLHFEVVQDGQSINPWLVLP